MDTIVIIPTYNNAGTVAGVVRRALEQGLPVLVVDDGSTDQTQAELQAIEDERLSVFCHPVNQGKAAALKTGFQEARKRGFRFAVTLDSDGQHYPEDIPLLLAQKAPRTLLVGSRSVRGVNGSSRFANRFSNFWFRLYTWVDLPDTQTGYRLYPLEDLPRFTGGRYEGELLLLVLSAWKGIALKPVSVRVDYPEDRVTHFRPVADFARISLLNTGLLFAALCYGYPRMLLRKIFAHGTH